MEPSHPSHMSPAAPSASPMMGMHPGMQHPSMQHPSMQPQMNLPLPLEQARSPYYGWNQNTQGLRTWLMALTAALILVVVTGAFWVDNALTKAQFSARDDVRQIREDASKISGINAVVEQTQRATQVTRQDLEQQIKALQTKLDQIPAASGSQVAQVQSDLSTARGEINNLRVSLGQAITEFNRLSTAVNQLSAIPERVNELDTGLDQLRQNLIVVQRTTANLQQQVRSLDTAALNNNIQQPQLTSPTNGALNLDVAPSTMTVAPVMLPDGSKQQTNVPKDTRQMFPR